MSRAARAAVAALRGREFYKLTGSGNDFAFFDIRGAGDAELLARPAVIRAVCARGTGVGADGVVLLDSAAAGSATIAYYNSDGGRAELCGNATLCTTRLAYALGIAGPEGGLEIGTDAGPIAASMVAHLPEIGIGRVGELLATAPAAAPLGTERRIAYARVGVPHLVVAVSDVDAVDVATRGAVLRAAGAARPGGANVNFVSRVSADRWRIRTFERGVEGETLACGTGAVAAAAVISEWETQRVGGEVALVTRGGPELVVRVPADPDGIAWLRGEGRIVYRGQLDELCVPLDVPGEALVQR